MRGRRLGAALVVGAVALGLVLGEAFAQQNQGSQITLVFEREVFTYQGQERRDPFQPLTQDNQLGPRFDQLSLQAIIYSDDTSESLALLRGPEGRVFRARVGDMIGNSRVLEIGPTRVVMAVETFGNVRQEILEMPARGGTE